MPMHVIIQYVYPIPFHISIAVIQICLHLSLSFSFTPFDACFACLLLLLRPPTGGCVWTRARIYLSPRPAQTIWVMCSYGKNDSERDQMNERVRARASTTDPTYLIFWISLLAFIWSVGIYQRNIFVCKWNDLALCRCYILLLRVINSTYVWHSNVPMAPDQALISDPRFWPIELANLAAMISCICCLCIVYCIAFHIIRFGATKKPCEKAQAKRCS